MTEASQDTPAGANPLRQLAELGQSIWYDNLSRELVTSGALAAMVKDDALSGVTSNPAIFQKSLAAGGVYDRELRQAVAEGAGDAKSVFETLAIRDIQLAADVLRPVYDSTQGADGFVSLEVSPYLAHNTGGTVEEARRLWAAVDRANLMIKVPGTPAGVPAIETLISEGIHVNVTLLFAVDAYEAVALAYSAGLEARHARGERVDNVASVASFFVSRIDAWMDGRLQQAIDNGGDAAALRALQGKAALANASLAYGSCSELHAAERWQKLAQHGARQQRLLWASTSTKNPSYPKTLYVDELVAPNTVNTLPGATYDDVKAGHAQTAKLADRGQAGVVEGRETIAALDAAGVSLAECTEVLLEQGVCLFADAFDTLLSEVEDKRRDALGTTLASQTLVLGDAEERVAEALDAWRRDGSVRRLWARDASLWTDGGEDRWLGWLDGAGTDVAPLVAIAEQAASGDFAHVALFGMGGSSLCPDLLARSFGRQAGAPELRVLDSTSPAQVASLDHELDPARTLFVVASKSGGTIEPNMFFQFFWQRVVDAVGETEAGRHFIAITDPGSNLETLARERGFRAVAFGDPTIGGRFSALSPFGLLPAALMGLDPTRLLKSAQHMADACAACVPPDRNPGVSLGVALSVLAKSGRDKLTLCASPRLAALGGWLEQLIAESTGKHGLGIVPIDGEALPRPGDAPGDRVFVALQLRGDEPAIDSATWSALAQAGHPLVRVELEELTQLAQEFFRWEIATAAAGAVLGLNPFDQPDVEAAKIAARAKMDEFEASGSLPESTATSVDDPELGEKLRGLLSTLSEGDYFSINAYLEMVPANQAPLSRLRHTVRSAHRVATSVGFGPRFLHSTGQLHKGGPNTGVFLQVIADDSPLPIPGQRYGFETLCAAQAAGDAEILAARGRRILVVNVGSNVEAGLASLVDAVEAASATTGGNG